MALTLFRCNNFVYTPLKKAVPPKKIKTPKPIQKIGVLK
jgi:hypothetical protein